MLDLTATRTNLTVIEGEVSDLSIEGNRVAGIVLADGSQISAHAVILTSGPFCVELFILAMFPDLVVAWETGPQCVLRKDWIHLI